METSENLLTLKKNIINSDFFKDNFNFGGIDNNADYFINMSTNNFNELFLDLAWINNNKITMHTDLSHEIEQMIEICANELNLSIETL